MVTPWGNGLDTEIMQGTMPGALRRGRPHTAWMDNIKTWTGLPVEESIRMTEDRDKWRKYVHGVADQNRFMTFPLVVRIWLYSNNYESYSILKQAVLFHGYFADRLSSDITTTRSVQPCFPTGLLNRVPASAKVKTVKSPLLGGR